MYSNAYQAKSQLKWDPAQKYLTASYCASKIFYKSNWRPPQKIFNRGSDSGAYFSPGGFSNQPKFDQCQMVQLFQGFLLPLTACIYIILFVVYRWQLQIPTVASLVTSSQSPSQILVTIVCHRSPQHRQDDSTQLVASFLNHRLELDQSILAVDAPDIRPWNSFKRMIICINQCACRAMHCW